MSALRQLNQSTPAQAGGTVDPMVVDLTLDDDEVEENNYEVDIDSFELETYANNYAGLGRIYRLMFIADHSPKLRAGALKLALAQVVTTMNTSLYESLYRKLKQCERNVLPDVTGECEVDIVIPTYSSKWVEITNQKAAIQLEKLDADLKNYKSNSIKESIRRGHNEIGDHYVFCGDLVEATKNYSKARDYCTSSSHVISMCLNIIKVGVYLQNWSQVIGFCIKAEATPDYTENSEIQTSYLSTLRCMRGLGELACCRYKVAAQNFLRLNLDSWDTNDVMTPNDVAIYGGLCALATYSRSELQSCIISNNTFKSFLELEPELRDAIFKFYESKYEICLKILNDKKPSLLLDLFIGSHINQLYINIRNKAIIQYFTPYDSADLTKMAKCFNTSLSDLEDELMQLILDGHIKARIDSINKVLYARHSNQRAETFEKALSMAQQYSRYMHILILKSQMIKHLTNAKNNEREGQSRKLSFNIDFTRRSDKPK